MYTEITKNIVTVEEGMILHGCNCQGAFGSGVAGAIRMKWPFVYEEFMKHGTGKDKLGTIDLIEVSTNPELVVINGYTQEFYGPGDKKYADLEAVESCLDKALCFAEIHKLDLYMPKIGCGLGGLSWKDEVEPLISNASEKFTGVNIFICDL